MKKLQIIPVLGLLLLVSFCGKDSSGDILAPGTVEGDIITLKSQVAGTLDIIHKKEGDAVTEGVAIAQINQDKSLNKLREFEISLKELEINRQKLTIKSRLIRGNISYLKKQVQRFRRLKKSQSIPGEKLENMELKLLEGETTLADLQKSRESLDIQEERIKNKMDYLKLVLTDHTVSSPVTGLVSELFVSKGENVFPNSSVADVLDTGSLYVEVFVEEQEITALSLNQEAVILVDGMEDKEFIGIVSHFGSKAEFSPKYIVSEKERKSLLYKVKVKLGSDLAVFKVGMPVTVLFKAAAAKEKND